ncbi:hypothetical protein [Rufibacter sp. XAAS-G3-1]|uniref:hypothetical protein n=1 Tax=Rufibacter sp. XAAS-G3-1 TaxID=2729134 RepID=UPI0015E7A43D|nr:hypothetical protein [Rufibacter sp. XAAS-G3-1]
MNFIDIQLEATSLGSVTFSPLMVTLKKRMFFPGGALLRLLDDFPVTQTQIPYGKHLFSGSIPSFSCLVLS